MSLAENERAGVDPTRLQYTVFENLAQHSYLVYVEDQEELACGTCNQSIYNLDRQCLTCRYYLSSFVCTYRRWNIVSLLQRLQKPTAELFRSSARLE